MTDNFMAVMQDRGESSSYRGRVRGQSTPSYRGRGGRGKPLVQHGNKMLIAEKLTGQAYKEWYRDHEKENPTMVNNPSYAAIINEEEPEKEIPFITNPYKEMIFPLEFSDLKWKDNVWKLMERYLEYKSYPELSYKHRMHSEHILKITGTAEFQHFTPNPQTSSVYNFSKVIIKQVITAEDWGQTSRQREYTIPNMKGSITHYNYWDYMDAFYKSFFYENRNHKHTWFFKICPSLHKAEKPAWLYHWWDQYGPKIDILPEPYRGLYQEWVKVSPALIEATEKDQLVEGMPSFTFFTEFGIPWIWRWYPIIWETTQGIPCIVRKTETKFWKKMLKPDEHGILEGQATIDNIQQAIKAYTEIQSYSEMSETPSPFKQMARRLKIQQGTISTADMMKAYIKAIKEDLVRNFPADTDVSMPTKSSATNSEDNTEEPEYTGEEEGCCAQPPESPQEIWERTMKFIDQWEQTASSKTPDPTNKGKGPASK